MYLKARNNGITAFDTYWSRLMSGAVYTEGQVSGLVSGDVMVDAGGVVSVADGTAIPGSLYGNGSTTAASVVNRSEEHTSELQSLMRHSYAVFCLNKKKNIHQ